MSERAESGKGKRDRSPSFPFIPLKTAIDRLVAFDEYFRRHPTPPDKAGLAWKMRGDSSQSLQTTAALKAFGLLAPQHTPDGNRLVVSRDGRTYLQARQDNIRAAILKSAALRPKQIAAYWHKWGADRPPDPVCLDDLILNGGFTEDGAEKFLKVYDQTIAFANLPESDKKEASEPGEKDADDDENTEDSASRPPPPRHAKARIMEGERELTTGLLSKGASFRLIVAGKIGPKEIDTLIKKLEIDKDILGSSDDDEPAGDDDDNA